jgi:hypothetical protein
MWRVLLLAACGGFQLVDPPSPSVSHLSSGDGGCLPATATTCRDPGPGTCFDYLTCVEACAGDSSCLKSCEPQPAPPQSVALANAYIQCRDRAVNTTCSSECVDPTTASEDACVACLHVCSYDASCNYLCSCGACAAELAACYADR